MHKTDYPFPSLLPVACFIVLDDWLCSISLKDSSSDFVIKMMAASLRGTYNLNCKCR